MQLYMEHNEISNERRFRLIQAPRSAVEECVQGAHILGRSGK